MKSRSYQSEQRDISKEVLAVISGVNLIYGYKHIEVEVNVRKRYLILRIQDKE